MIYSYDRGFSPARNQRLAIRQHRRISWRRRRSAIQLQLYKRAISPRRPRIRVSVCLLQIQYDFHVPSMDSTDSRFTVPVLWDKKLNTVVNNESSEIIRMFNTAFNDILPSDKAALDLYPAAHRAEIDVLNEWVYSDVNSASRLLKLNWHHFDALCRRCISRGLRHTTGGVRNSRHQAVRRARQN